MLAESCRILQHFEDNMSVIQEVRKKKCSFFPLINRLVYWNLTFIKLINNTSASQDFT